MPRCEFRTTLRDSDGERQTASANRSQRQRSVFRFSGRDSEQHSFLRGSGLGGAAVSAARCAGETPTPQRLFLMLKDPEVATSSPVLLIAAAALRRCCLSLPPTPVHRRCPRSLSETLSRARVILHPASLLSKTGSRLAIRGGDSDQRQGQGTAISVQRQRTGVSVTLDWHGALKSRLRVEQSPSHCTHLIKGLHRVTGSVRADRPGVSEKLQVAVDLFRRGVGDSPGVRPVSTDSAVPFCQIRRDRTCRTDHLIGYRLQRSWNPHHELDRDSCGFECFRVGNEVGVRGGFGHGHLRVVHAPTHKPVWRPMSRMPCTLPVLDIGRPPATPSFERPGGGHFAT